MRSTVVLGIIQNVAWYLLIQFKEIYIANDTVDAIIKKNNFEILDAIITRGILGHFDRRVFYSGSKATFSN